MILFVPPAYVDMSKAVYVTVDFPESVNRMYKPNGFGGVRKTDEAKDYFKYANLTARGAMQAAGLDVMTGWVGVDVVLYRPTLRGDIDNYNKGLLDAFQDAIYHKDSQIVDLNIRKRLDRLNPRVTVVCYPVLIEMESKDAKRRRARKKN